MAPDDDTLVAAAAGGDRNALEQLLRTHHDAIRAVCFRIVIDKGAAEDATQAALMAVARSIRQFKGTSKFSTWAYRIATNAALDEVRRTRRRPVPTDDASLGRASAPQTDPADLVIDNMALEAALAQVSEDFRVPLVLFHLRDMPYEEIAEVLGIPVNTVRSRISRARAQLRDLLGNPGGVPDRHKHDLSKEQGER
ncbi:MAG: RNA polymerase sigma factor [Actinomycetota bacterium]